MVAGKLDGRDCANSIEASLSMKMSELGSKEIVPHLAVVIVGDDSASHVYVAAKERACQRLGIKSSKFSLPATANWGEVISLVESLNEDEDVDGILVQSPLPDGMDEIAISELISPDKDVDGFHPVNLGKLVQGRTDGMLPCTPHGVMKLLESASVELSGKRAVIIGRSRIVGMPMALLLSRKGVDATVTIAHSRTTEIGNLCSKADILVAAVGRPEFVSADWVKEGAIVVDVGVNRVDDPTQDSGYRITGDVHQDASNVASFISPVPGGVGPMTIAMLMSNTIQAALLRNA